MPLYYQTVNHFVSTAHDFIAHWQNVNTQSAQPLILAGPVTLQNLQDLQQAFLLKQFELIDAQNDVKVARQNNVLQAKCLQSKLKQFNTLVRGLPQTLTFAEMLPKIVTAGSSQQATLRPLREATLLWQQLTVLGQPIVLAGGYSRANFDADIAALEESYAAHQQFKQNERIILAERNALQREIRVVLLRYRKTVLASFAETSPYVVSLPRYSPVRRKKA